MDKILITGNLGYNGLGAVKALKANGFFTIGLDTDFYQDLFFDNADYLPDIQIKKDIRNLNANDLLGIDYVVHLGALANDAIGELDPAITYQINHISTINLAKLAKEAGAKKFLFASSCSAYGIQEGEGLANEESPLNPLTAYAKAKVLSEQDLIGLNSNEFKVIIMRNATMHGLSPKLRLDLVVNNLTASAHISDKVKILSDGTPWRPLLSLKDFANIVVLFLKENPKRIIYNIGFNQENYQVRDIGKIVADLSGGDLEINSAKTPDERSYRVDFSVLANEFPELKMEMSVRDSAKELLLAYQENNLTEEDFNSEKYFRIRKIKKLLDQGEIQKDLFWTEESSKIKMKMKELASQYYQLTKKNIGKDKAPVSGKIFNDQEFHNLIEAVLDGWWTEGRWSEMLENKIKSFLDMGHCLLTNSGSSANFLALKILASPVLKERQIKIGDEIITTACGFPTTVNAILDVGALPVFVDVNLETFNAKLSSLEKAITNKTKAIFLAHTLGNPFSVLEVKELCNKHNIWLIEDNCDAFGSKYKNQYTGTFGDLSTLSFYPAHHITTGEGGAVLTNNALLAKIGRSIRDWGRDCWCPTGKDNTCSQRFNQQLGLLPFGYDHKFTYSEIGYNLKTTDLNSAIGVAQMDKVEGFNQKRKENFSYLFAKMKELEDYFILPKATENSEPSWFGFLLTIKDNKINRTELLKFLNESGVGTRLLFGGNLTKQPYFIANNIKYKLAEELKNTDIITESSFWVGVYPGLGQENLDHIVSVIKQFINNKT